MQRVILFCCLLGLISQSLAQQAGKKLLLHAPASWSEERIEFPIDWAPDLTLNGYEELRFPPQWEAEDAQTFWSIALVWNVAANAPLSQELIVKNIEAYFDGLMKPNHWSQAFPEPNFLLLPTTADHRTFDYWGKLKVFDGFHTGSMIGLYVKVRQRYCPDQKRAQVLFTFSPKGYTDPIWQDLDQVGFFTDSCSR